MITVPFYCPMCGKSVQATLLEHEIIPHPAMPSLRCPDCETRWLISVREANEDDPYEATSSITDTTSS